MGRPIKAFNAEMIARFEFMCERQCTQAEVCAEFDVDPDTLSRMLRDYYGDTFSKVFEIKRQKGLFSLRAKQYDTAMTGSVPMQIWLGKNWLKQADRQELSLTPNEEGKTPIVHIPGYSEKLTPPPPATPEPKTGA